MSDLNKEQKKKALADALTQIEKSHGKGSIRKLGAKGEVTKIECIPTGALNLDAIMGGGAPRGRITEIYGPESSGKTTLCLHIVANAQRAGGIAAYIDSEHALDLEYARKLGVDVENLLLSQPDHGEQALNIVQSLVDSGAVDIVVVDSVAALTPKAEIDGEIGDSFVGLQARMMGQALRKLTGSLGRSKTTLIFINQLREKIGVMFGSPETTTGGKALKFYASVRLDIRRTGAIKNGEEVIGSATKVKTVKNKIAPPFRQAEFEILYGEGINKLSLLIDAAAERGIFEKSGSWYSYKGAKFANGKENAKLYLKDNPALLAEVEPLVVAALQGADAPVAAPAEE
jgi:recombination protein RecA